MAKRFLTPLNLPNLASNPETGAEGDLYFNTVDNVIKIYINDEWTDLQGSASAGNFVIYQDEQPDVTNLPTGTIWVDSDAVVVGGGGGSGGGVGLNNWTENENGDLIPNTTEQNIGSEEYPVNEIYVSGSTIYIGETTLSVEDGELNIGGSKVITESNADDNLDLSNYLTISTASTTYATKQELEEIDLTQTINTASAAAFASASAYTDEQLSLIDLTETINTASAAAFGSASAYTNEAISDLIGGAPETLDTLQEIAAALDENPEVLDLFLTKQEFAGASASFYRWTKTYSASATVISGVDDNEITLEYDEGYEQVFINGVMIEPSEYTRTSASVITLDEAVNENDVVDIFAYRNAFSTNTYSQSQIDAKYNSFSRWRKIYSASASVITGVDDNSLSLSYTPGFEQVYLNGILLTKDEDYTATNSSTVTLNQAVAINDVIEVLSFQPFNIADTYTQTEADNKFLTQSSASTTYLTESGASETYLNKDAGYFYKQTVYFTTSGTFNKAEYPWLRAIKVKMVGGGGGSAAAAATNSSQVSVPGSGGGGGYCEKFYTDINSLSSSITVTVGAGGTAGTSGGNGGGGGTTSFLTLSATGGGGGSAPGAGSIAFHYSNCGTAGSASNGDLNIQGSGGISGNAWALDRVMQAVGGESFLSGRFHNAVSTTAQDAVAGFLYGGGAVAPINAINQSARNGAAGGPGIVILELYS